jgi:hypothetical protein
MYSISEVFTQENTTVTHEAIVLYINVADQYYFHNL